MTSSSILSEAIFRLRLEAVINERDLFRRDNGKRLRKWRELHGITLRRAARAAGISPSFLSDIEHGKRGLSEIVRNRIVHMKAEP